MKDNKQNFEIAVINILNLPDNDKQNVGIGVRDRPSLRKKFLLRLPEYKFITRSQKLKLKYKAQSCSSTSLDSQCSSVSSQSTDSASSTRSKVSLSSALSCPVLPSQQGRWDCTTRDTQGPKFKTPSRSYSSPLNSRWESAPTLSGKPSNNRHEMLSKPRRRPSLE